MHKTKINIASPKPALRSILIIYTGGTLGMSYDKTGKHLIPFDFNHILENIPELRQFEYELTVLSLQNLIDSSNMRPSLWIEIAQLIGENYTTHDGFVVLHGTDTMAYTASALSFLLENLNKPVILTGAQLPIGSVRTDAHRNLVTSIQIAAAEKNGRPLVSEVCIFFNDVLLRGNRAKKVISSRFDAFYSENYPVLARAGIHVNYQASVLLPHRADRELKVYDQMDENVAILKIFPGISKQLSQCVLVNPQLRGLILETYGSGNAPTDAWFIEILEEALARGVMILNVSQCLGGRVEQGRYATSRELARIGVLSGVDMTLEAAITKLMFVLGQEIPSEEKQKYLTRSLRGELSD